MINLKSVLVHNVTVVESPVTVSKRSLITYRIQIMAEGTVFTGVLSFILSTGVGWVSGLREADPPPRLLLPRSVRILLKCIRVSSHVCNKVYRVYSLNHRVAKYMSILACYPCVGRCKVQKIPVLADLI